MVPSLGPSSFSFLALSITTGTSVADGINLLEEGSNGCCKFGIFGGCLGWRRLLGLVGVVGKFIHLGAERLELRFFFSKDSGEVPILEGQFADNEKADVVLREGDINYTCILEVL